MNRKLFFPVVRTGVYIALAAFSLASADDRIPVGFKANRFSKRSIDISGYEVLLPDEIVVPVGLRLKLPQRGYFATAAFFAHNPIDYVSASISYSHRLSSAEKARTRTTE